MKFGFIGAGYISRALAALLIKNGHEVMLSNSRDPRSLYVTGAMLKALVGTREEAIAFGDVVLLAIPFFALDTIKPEALDGKLVVDVVNYHPLRDGPVEALVSRERTTSELVAKHFPGAKIVKAFNAILAPDVEDLVRTGPSHPRRALPLAFDDPQAGAQIAALYSQLGFDPLEAGSLADSWRFERNKPAYCARQDREALLANLAKAERDVELEDGYWDD